MNNCIRQKSNDFFIKGLDEHQATPQQYQGAIQNVNSSIL